MQTSMKKKERKKKKCFEMRRGNMGRVLTASMSLNSLHTLLMTDKGLNKTSQKSIFLKLEGWVGCVLSELGQVYLPTKDPLHNLHPAAPPTCIPTAWSTAEKGSSRGGILLSSL